MSTVSRRRQLGARASLDRSWGNPGRLPATTLRSTDFCYLVPATRTMYFTPDSGAGKMGYLCRRERHMSARLPDLPNAYSHDVDNDSHA